MWYTCSLLFKALHERSPESDPVCEERFLLVEAESEATARLVAEESGRSGEHKYHVSKVDDDVLKWIFAGVQKVYAIEDETLRSGTELFSRFVPQSMADQLRQPFAGSPGRRSLE